ncbi:MAG: PAS domain S-box protein [Gemmatimonadaceae bacterium]|nr:PAS domain S-box protein [Gemmatimonadaceae bacterium]
MNAAATLRASPNERSARAAGQRPGPWTLLFCANAAFYIVLRVIRPAGLAWPVYEQLAFLPFSGGLALAFLVAARRLPSDGLRRSFQLYAATFALTAVGAIVTCLQLTVFDVDPTYSWPNLAYLLGYPLAVAAIRAIPSPPAARERRLRTLLDTAIAVVAAVTITWLEVVRPLAATTDGWQQRAILFAYPIGDLGTFAILVPLLLTLRFHADAGVLRLLTFSQLAYLGGDLGYQLVDTGIASAMSLAVDGLFLVGYVGMMWAVEAAALRPTEATRALVPPTTDEPRNPLPILLGFVVYALLIAEARVEGSSLLALALAALGVTILVLAREALTERLNRGLARNLAAARSEARIRSVVGQLATGVIVFDSEGRIAVSNPAATALLDRSEAQLSGQTGASSTWDVVHDDGTPAPDPFQVVEDARRLGRQVRGSMIGLARPEGGDRRWLIVEAAPHTTVDGVEVVCTIHDVTERRARDDRLRRSQRMEAVGRLAGGVAHDFNNLLTAISGYASMLLNGLRPQDPRGDDVREILKASDRAATLTQQLLAFGGRQHRRVEVLNLNALVQSATRLLRSLVGPGISVRFQFNEQLARVLVDRGQIEQVLVNLVLNARDAMNRDGTIVIATDRVAPDDARLPPGFQLPEAGGVGLSVTDSGEGMSESVRRRAFDPFFTTKDVGRGSGLGLSIVYGIVVQSRGEVWIESDVGRGTRVQVVFPVHSDS